MFLFVKCATVNKVDLILSYLILRQRQMTVIMEITRVQQFVQTDHKEPSKFRVTVPL